MNVKDKIKYFEKRVKYYFYDFFKLYELSLHICPQEKIGVRASSYWHELKDGAGLITICYTKAWLDCKDTTKAEIDEVAFHEVCESMLWELQELCKSRFICEKDIPNAVHRVIRRLENVVYPNIMDKRSNK
jgi:hypothetical protein